RRVGRRGGGGLGGRRQPESGAGWGECCLSFDRKWRGWGRLKVSRFWGWYVLKKKKIASVGIRKLVYFNEIKRPTSMNPVCNMFKNQIQSYKLLFLIFGPCCATLIHNKK
ncbi:unnamed protein product, partial [Linum tenue]